MDLIITTLIIVLSVTFSGTIVLLLFYYLRSKKNKDIHLENKGEFFQLSKGIESVKSDTSEILKTVSNMNDSLGNSFDLSNKINIREFLKERNIDKYNEENLSNKHERFVFNLNINGMRIVSFNIISNKETKISKYIAFSTYLKKDNMPAYKYLLNMNAKLIPRLTVVDIKGNKVIGVEMSAPTELPSKNFDLLFKILIETCAIIEEESKKKQWAILTSIKEH